MSDLIDRQAAIDECYPITVDGEVYEVVQVETLMGLPSAQPTQTNAPNALKSLDCISRQAAIDAKVGKGATVDPEVKCLFCGHHVAERPFEVYCNIMCKWVNEKDYCAIFEPHPVLHDCGTKMKEAKQ